jgi:hypothetical protein
MTAKQNISPPPLLSEKHNGIPERLLDRAQKAKTGIFEIATKPQSNRTQIALPQGVSSSAFHQAIKDLRGQIGQENVELVTRLVDGWYVVADTNSEAYPINSFFIRYIESKRKWHA